MKSRQRLRRPGEFQRVLRSGRLFAGRNLVGFAVPTRHAGSRIGVAVSRKLRGSVRRNRVKRRLREVARLELLAQGSPLLEKGIAYDVVLVARPAALEAPFRELIGEAAAFLARLCSRPSAEPGA